jgi:hypothetical protein
MTDAADRAPLALAAVLLRQSGWLARLASRVIPSQRLRL